MYEIAEQLLTANRPNLVRGGTVVPPWAEPPGNPMEIPSPDGKHVVFRRDYNLWIRSDGNERPLTTDGDVDHDYGANPDYFMYAPMFTMLGLPHAPPAAVWSPDSTKVLTHRTIQEGLRIKYLLSSDGLRSKRSALPGDEQVQLAEFVVVDVCSGAVLHGASVPMPMLSPIQMKWAWWAADAVYYLSTSDGLALHRLDPESGLVRTVVHESGEGRILPGQHLMLGPAVYVLPSGDVLWYSGRDGWGHLYLYSDCSMVRQVTSGPWQVKQILRVADDVVHFVAVGLVSADPYRSTVCRVGLDGTGFAVVTADELDHVVVPGVAGFLDTASTPDTPPVHVVRSWDGHVVEELGRADISALLETGWSPPERFCVKSADGSTDVYGVLYCPHGFDPAVRYPVVDHTYLNPFVTRVSAAFDAGWHGHDAEALAALGFVVIAVDGRGTPGRDKAFWDASYQNMSAGLDDHVAALRQLAMTRPWMDLDRVGICGLSGGGFATVRAMLDHPDVYKVGVALSGVHDYRYTDPATTDMYGPYDADVFAGYSNVDSVDGLAGKLMLVHGGLDDQVSPDQTYRLAEALIAAGKDFELLIVPGADHVFTGYETYVHRRTWDFLLRHLR
ncbi:prolyl oligopeptidase family serine peptidase [Kibdelosporangium philippinense]|uniref:Prolyl oligopeptidase family serine peptidase n=1 Tax=Kibdelosporangium philippinense TaxID=211113 RepID=A0ABS8ZHL9_9PSEU|nr:prolyl oligopeptidase family serine peptidase [Kibdelosporangium philippinense]MCE7007305.1 prolyl oligopeptidase family serine peptidase [Kibdelosporangium philippinense]